MATRGRPRGLNINPHAVEDLLARACLTKAELAAAAGCSAGHLADMLHRGKGASPTVVRAMATALGCSAETIAPTLLPLFVSVRPGDAVVDDEAAA